MQNQTRCRVRRLLRPFGAVREANVTVQSPTLPIRRARNRPGYSNLWRANNSSTLIACSPSSQ